MNARPRGCPCRGCRLSRRGITETVPHVGHYAGRHRKERDTISEVVTALTLPILGALTLCVVSSGAPQEGFVPLPYAEHEYYGPSDEVRVGGIFNESAVLDASQVEGRP